MVYVEIFYMILFAKDYFSPITLTDGNSTLMLAMTDVVMLIISIDVYWQILLAKDMIAKIPL